MINHPTNKITFKPLQENDLALLMQWFNKPHVKQWWNLSKENIIEEYRTRIGDQDVMPFIIYADENPVGFFQYYYATRAGEGWWPDEDEGTIGIDQFIGEEEYLSRGIGTLILKEFIEIILKDAKHTKIILDVHPENHRAIRCYEKAGFIFVKQVMTPDGLANLMVFPAQQNN